MIIPWEQLNTETLTLMIEEYVTRDGTDYGDVEVGLETRVEQVRSKLKQGIAVILFSQSTGQCNIVARDRL